MNKHTLYVPTSRTDTSTYNGLVKNLILAAGGVTTTQANGTWVAPNGEVINEPITLLTVFNDKVSASQVETCLIDIIRYLKYMGEHTVLVEVQADTSWAYKLL